MDPNQIEGLNDALVLEIKAEMGRRDLSSRALGRLIGESSQYVSSRLDGGNPKTGKRVPLNVADLAAIASAMDVSPGKLFERAVAAVLGTSMQSSSDRPIDADSVRPDLVDSSGRVVELKAPKNLSAIADSADLVPGGLGSGGSFAKKTAFTDFDDADIAARDEDREKPKID